MKILAVTACPLGLVYTYMAAEALQIAAQKRNIEIKVETQGTIGVENILTSIDVNDAAAVILTKDKAIENAERFEGKLVFYIGIKEAIRNSNEIIERVEVEIKEKLKLRDRI